VTIEQSALELVGGASGLLPSQATTGVRSQWRAQRSVTSASDGIRRGKPLLRIALRCESPTAPSPTKSVRPVWITPP
jgi:hypothetical protein